MSTDLNEVGKPSLGHVGAALYSGHRDPEGEAWGGRCSGVLEEAGAGVQERMRERSSDGKRKEMRLALQLGPRAGFLIHSKCEGKLLKDFVQDNDTIKFLCCESHSSSHVGKTV